MGIMYSWFIGNFMGFRSNFTNKDGDLTGFEFLMGFGWFLGFQ
jgi:hypothetical protein